MKLHSLLFIVCFWVFNNRYAAQAQQLFASETFDNNLDEVYNLVGAIDTLSYVYGKHAAGDYLYIYNDTLAISKEIRLKYEQKNHQLIKTFLLNTKIYVLYSYGKNGGSIIRLKIINPDGTEWKDALVGNFKYNYKFNKEHLQVSNNKKQLLLYAPQDNNQLEIIQFDLENCLLARHQQLALDRFNYYKNFEKIRINNSGTIYVVSSFNNTKKKCPEHHLMLYECSDSIRMHPLYLRNFVAFDFDIQYDEINKQLVGAGFYGEDRLHALGVFYFNTKLGATDKVRSNAFDASFIRSLTGNKKKTIKGINNFYIEQSILRQDGGLLILAEQQFAYQSAMPFEDDLQDSPQADYLYENILAVSMHPDGRIFWKKALLKSQNSSNDEAQFSSFFTMKTTRNLRLVYNNKIDWNTTIFEYLLKNNGEVRRQVVKHQDRKDGLLPKFRQSIQTTANQFIALSYRDKDIRLVKIIY